MELKEIILFASNLLLLLVLLFQNKQKYVQKILFPIFLIILIFIVLTLLVWSIFFLIEIKYKIASLGIAVTVISAMISVYSVVLGHQKTKERELDHYQLKGNLE